MPNLHLVSQTYLQSFDHQPIYLESHQNTTGTSFTHDILFVHGIGGDTTAFLPLIEMLLNGLPNCRCSVYDLRGHGFSGRTFPHKPTNLIAVLLQDLKSVLAYLNSPELIIIGQSLGGVVCQEYLLSGQKPTPAKLIFISSTLKVGWSFKPQIWYQVLRLKSQFFPTPTRKRTLTHHLNFKNSWDYSPGRAVLDAYYSGFCDYFLLWLSAFGWHNPKPEVLNHSSVLYIYSDRDQIVSARFQQSHLKSLNQLRKHSINSNHNSVVNNPELLVPLINEFVRL